MANRCKKCGQEFHPVGCPQGEHGLCRDCWACEFPEEYAKHKESSGKLVAFLLSCACPPLFLLFFPKGTCKVIGFFFKILFNKWILTLVTCGLSWLLWKGLNKIYSK